MKERVFFHYYTMDMHRQALQPLFNELIQRGWREGVSYEPRLIAFVTCGEHVKREYRNSSPIIWLPHGLSPSKWAFPMEFGFRGSDPPDFLLLPGPFYEQRLRFEIPQYLRMTLSRRIVGWPRADALFNGSITPADVKHPMVLFAPSWNGKSLETVGTGFLVNKVREVLEDCDYEIVIAPHPAEFKWFDDSVLKVADLRPYLLAADVVITDQSSIGIEAALIDRPVVHLLELYRLRGWSPFDGETFTVGHIATIDTLRECVLDALEHPAKYDYLRRYWREAMLSYPGEGAKRAADVVEELVAPELEGEFC